MAKEQGNSNATTDTTADCLLSKANIEQITTNIKDIHRLLTILTPSTSSQYGAIEIARNTLALWEKKELQAVRVAFEKE